MNAVFDFFADFFAWLFPDYSASWSRLNIQARLAIGSVLAVVALALTFSLLTPTMM